jgi:drug/metabolite transporter (DMT)-like permease
MDTTLVLAALLSALLHASWTAAVKHTGQTTEAMTGQMVAAALVSLPLLLWLPWPAAQAWGWMAASCFFNWLGILCLLRAYERGAYGAVYPLSRATMVLVIAPLSVVFAGERLSVAAWIGIACIASSLVLMASQARGGQRLGTDVLGWTLLGGVFSAICVMLDVQGIRSSGSPIAYGCCAAVVNGSLMLLRQRRRPGLWTAIVRHRRVVVGSGVVSMASYLLIVWVFTQAPMAISAALRDTSALFAVLISVFVLKEKLGRLQQLAVLVAGCAVPLLRL